MSTAATMKRIAFFIPFQGCGRRCVYCDQVVITGDEGGPSPETVKSCLARQSEPVELCFFGGSFARLSLAAMESYMETIREAPEGSVVTFSSYPGDFGGERGANLADFLSRRPIGTIELGTPSLDPRVLRICGRDDDPEDVKKNIAFLRDAGFHLGMQTMIGLPGQSFDSAQSDITALASLMRDAKPPVWDLRIYPCLVLEGTPLEAMFDRGEYVPLPLEEAVIETGKLLITAEREGFRVIRVGLLESRSLKSGVKAGPYHPSFGELALSEKLALLLVKMAPEGPWEIDSKRVSQLLGHARRGLRRMSQLTGIPEKIILNRLILI